MNDQHNILLVEDDPLYSSVLKEALEDAGYLVKCAMTAAEAIEASEQCDCDVALLDIRLPDIDGLHVLKALKENQPDCTVIVMTGHASVESAVKAIRQGAYDYLSKPFPTEALLMKLQRILNQRKMEDELAALRSSTEGGGIVGRNRRVLSLLQTLKTVSGTDATVVIQGESGTGKELVADYLHFNSRRRDGPLVKVNCGAVPESLMESELFGFEKGSFTGADRQRIGTLEQASRGTLFLDEIGEIPASMQIKLLRALQDRRIRRVGGIEDIPVDFRLIAATNRDVGELVEEGILREDFYFRLNVIPVTVPPLRERSDDIPLLIEYFVARHSAAHDLSLIRFQPDAVELLVSYSWPGNVRELQNVIERVQVLHPGSDIGPRHLPKEIRKSQSSEGVHIEAVSTDLELRAALRQFERRYIERIIEEEDGNKAAAARRLGVARETLWKKLND